MFNLILVAVILCFTASFTIYFLRVDYLKNFRLRCKTTKGEYVRTVYWLHDADNTGHIVRYVIYSYAAGENRYEVKGYSRGRSYVPLECVVYYREKEPHVAMADLLNSVVLEVDMKQREERQDA